MAAEVVPDQDPQWGYNTPEGVLTRGQFTTCLLDGLCKAVLKPVNYENLQEVVQGWKENPSQFPECLTKAFLQHTNLDTESTEGRQLLMTYFFLPELPQHQG